MTLSPDQSLFLFVANILPTTGDLMRELYGRYREEDGFLYIKYCGESTFG